MFQASLVDDLFSLTVLTKSTVKYFLLKNCKKQKFLTFFFSAKNGSVFFLRIIRLKF